MLPGLLDGQKKYYQDRFAAIPLVPKPGDTDEPDMLPTATQALPSQPPEGAAEEVRAGNAFVPGIASLPVNTGAGIDAAPVTREQPKPRPIEKPQSKPVVNQTVEQPAIASLQPVKTEKPVKQQVQDQAPTGQAYIVQLGALKNADKVNEIVGKLRAAGFRVYTVPQTPVQGKITRILVGPEVSKEKLKSSLGELNKLSGLSGVVMNYSVRQG